MKPIRIIPLFAALLLALHGAGVVRTIHNLSHHSQPVITQSCDHSSEQSNPTKQALSDQPTDQPTDQQDDQDCDLCLTLNSITPSLSAPELLTSTHQPITQIAPRSSEAAPSIYFIADRPTRGPPLS